MKITDEIIDSYFICKLKAEYKYESIEFSDPSFYYHKKSLQTSSLEKFYTNYWDIKFINTKTLSSKIDESISLKNYYLHTAKYKIYFPYLSFDKKSITPIFILNQIKISQEYKKACSSKTILLSQTLNQNITHYQIITHDGMLQKFKVSEIKEKEVDKIESDLENNSIKKSKHCNMCEYKSKCLLILKRRDDLRLLGSISESEVQKWNDKGYFSIHQLSYYYKPRKRSLITSTRSRYKYELKALSLRENKIYFTGDILFSNNDQSIYIDFETLPEEDFVYLISAVVVRNDRIIKKCSFWANTIHQEEKIFKKLFDLVNQFDDHEIYHYGNFEIQELNKFNIKYNEKYSNEIENIIERSHNLLEYFYEKIFVPIYTNSLKDICHFIGFNWSSKNATGLQSIVWRKQWENSESRKIKNKLITYNLEDSLALFELKKWLMKLQNSKIQFINLYEMYSSSGYKFGNTKYEIDTFNHINQTAYFDYQRSKVFIKDKAFQNNINKKNFYKNQHFLNKPNKKAYSEQPTYCIKCLNDKFYTHEKSIRLIIDLKFTKNGIKKHVIEYHHFRYKCSHCNYIYSDKKFSKAKYGDNLLRWIIYTYMTYHLSLGDISKMSNVFFNIDINRSFIIMIKKKISNLLNEDYEELKYKILSSSAIHIDETTVIINRKKHYVWVLTDMVHVLYLFRENRTTNFLQEWLKDFKGILISDFYTGYESLKVIQQKCLIHLMRDINDLIFKNQDNNELIFVGKQFAYLLNIIITTIDRFGI
ncbi:MAG: TM0106 family RecB-like putative nuclease [Aliarcobacter sp.]|nr:TM0106 family RecB-like putative nuclease [Aliarcobacter sp.]